MTDALFDFYQVKSNCAIYVFLVDMEMQLVTGIDKDLKFNFHT